MKNLIAGILFIPLLLTACNSSKNKTDEGVDSLSCPLSLPIHEYRLFLPESFEAPAKTAIYVNDILKYDDCLNGSLVTDENPSIITFFERKEESSLVRVRDYDIQSDLPSSTSIRLFDRGSCDSEIQVFEQLNIELNFIDVYPHGKECVGDRISEAQL